MHERENVTHVNLFAQTVVVGIQRLNFLILLWRHFPACNWNGEKIDGGEREWEERVDNVN